MLTPAENKTLDTFRTYQMTPNKMLCFWGTTLERHKAGLALLERKELVVREKWDGGYSLTEQGFETMRGPRDS